MATLPKVYRRRKVGVSSKGTGRSQSVCTRWIVWLAWAKGTLSVAEAATKRTPRTVGGWGSRGAVYER